MKLTFRPGTPTDAGECGRICFEAFAGVSHTHNFPPDIPSPEAATGLLTWMLAHPHIYSVIAEQDGRIVGSNFLDERDAIAGVGPITVDSSVQNKAIGRQLMDCVLERAAERRFAGVRLVQAAFHNRSLSLYTKLGFDVREPLACMQGPALHANLAGYKVRPATKADLEACNRVCRQIHGHDRSRELSDMIDAGNAKLVEHNGRVTGYTTIIGFFGHAVGETNEELKALIGATETFAGPGFLLPARNGELFRWCLANGLRVVQPLTLMSRGLYNEPTGAFLPSILF